MKYRIWHRTAYTYDREVRNSLGLAHMAPRALGWQRVSAHTLEVDPVPGDVRRDEDCYGNTVTFFQIVEAHRELTVEAATDVDVAATEHDPASLAVPWETARPLRNGAVPGAWAATQFALASPRVPHVPAATAYAAASLPPGRSLGEAVADLMHRITADFTYDKAATTVTSTVADVLRTRAGVCQDFAHLALACLRGHGLAARYVSGYLATTPPPGKERVFGADASHAWVAVWVPGSDHWLAFDPTNDLFTADRHITVAWGRDYGDVTPVKGIIFTKAKSSTLRVSVDVAPLP